MTLKQKIFVLLRDFEEYRDNDALLMVHLWRDEIKNFIDYLKSEFKELRNAELYKVADSFYIRESKHFMGEHLLSVNEVLESKSSALDVAVGSYPVDAGKFAGYSSYIVGKPYQYGVPLGCIIPLEVDNLLMVGGKISYSSLFKI